jgi:cytochrome c-type biogenesis protein CcsB
MNRIIRWLFSFRATVVLLSLLMLMLAGATFLEKFCGTSVAREFVYHSPILYVLFALLVANFFLYSRNKLLLLFRRLGFLMVHCSFILILSGAMITHFCSVEGVMHLREGDTVDYIDASSNGEKSIHDLPFAITLDDFRLVRYPGSGSPSSYESYVTLSHDGISRAAHIYMNNVLDIKGYRLYQTSFDSDEKGSVLTVCRDSAGRTVTYMGYVLLFIGLIVSLFDRKGRFRYLCRKLQSAAVILLIPFLLFSGTSLYAESDETVLWHIVSENIVPPENAERFGELPMQAVDGRMKPVNTFSSEILRKVVKDKSVCGMNSDQFLLSLLIFPDVWAQLPVIAVGSDEVVEKYAFPSHHVSFIQMFDSSGRYLLENELHSIYMKPSAERTRIDKDILKLDERVNVFDMLCRKQLMKIFPRHGASDRAWYAPGDDLTMFSGKDSLFVSKIFDWYLDELSEAVSGSDWAQADRVLGMISTYQQAKASGVDVSPEKMHAEVLYNRSDIFARCRTAYFLVGILMLLLSVLSSSAHRFIRVLRVLLISVFIAVFVSHTFGIGVRWYVSGYAPWTNSYETMVYAAWATAFAGMLFLRRNAAVVSLATIFAGVILSVSGMQSMDPQITSLVPVLKSPWLTFHVAVIVAAYGFLGLSFMAGILDMALMVFLPYSADFRRYCGRIREITVLNEMSMWIGLVLLTIGTFLGAIWANESWGRYWGWDPKETWALITILVYAMATHVHLLKTRVPEWTFSFMSVVSFSSVLMTFLGVNHFLSGMHSYAQNDGFSASFLWIGVGCILICLLAILSYVASLRYMDIKKKR